MVRDRQKAGAVQESVISIIGPGMTVVGDCETDGTLRVEGTVHGGISAGKAVVVGKDGVVQGDIRTQDAVIAGHVTGTLVAQSRLELQSTAQIDGDVRARRMRLEEGAMLNGTVLMGEDADLTSPVAGGEVPRNADLEAAGSPPPGSGRSPAEAPEEVSAGAG